MTRYNRNDFILTDTREKFELELENGKVVEFIDPNRLSAEDSFALETASSKRSFELFLGNDFEEFWKEWKDRPVGELNLLIESVGQHFRAKL